jgi:hypothetical protein
LWWRRRARPLPIPADVGGNAWPWVSVAPALRFSRRMAEFAENVTSTSCSPSRGGRPREVSRPTGRAPSAHEPARAPPQRLPGCVAQCLPPGACRAEHPRCAMGAATCSGASGQGEHQFGMCGRQPGLGGTQRRPVGLQCGRRLVAPVQRHEAQSDLDARAVARGLRAGDVYRRLRLSPAQLGSQRFRRSPGGLHQLELGSSGWRPLCCRRRRRRLPPVPRRPGHAVRATGDPRQRPRFTAGALKRAGTRPRARHWEAGLGECVLMAVGEQCNPGATVLRPMRAPAAGSR